MALGRLDHVNIRTARLAEMSAFYRDVLGLEPGWRPSFASGGAWLYSGKQAVVHLVEVARPPRVGEPRIEHFAFRAEGLAEFLARLREFAIEPNITIVPDLGLRQVNILDPDGNHIEVTFGAEEELEPTARA